MHGALPTADVHRLVESARLILEHCDYAAAFLLAATAAEGALMRACVDLPVLPARQTFQSLLKAAFAQGS
jgi:hypothetical protein